MSNFDQMHSSASSLEANLVIALYAALIGMIGNLLGLVCLLIALYYQCYRSPWFFWFMTIYAALLLPIAPIGTVLGIVVLIYIIPRQQEFWSGQDGVIKSDS
ncbi:hypothetical protein ACWPKS_05340 [Coraliomargarita sp. W4R72]